MTSWHLHQGYIWENQRTLELARAWLIIPTEDMLSINMGETVAHILCAVPFSSFCLSLYYLTPLSPYGRSDRWESMHCYAALP